MRTRLLTTVATPLFALIACAQQFPSAYPSSTNGLGLQQQNPGAVDCSDPEQATSPQCALGRGGGFGSSGLQMPGMGPEALPGQPGRVTTYYDEGTRQRWPQASQTAVQLPPEPLTEFQKFVASTTG